MQSGNFFAYVAAPLVVTSMVACAVIMSMLGRNSGLSAGDTKRVPRTPEGKRSEIKPSSIKKG